jgi:thiamine kinase-like enzyme
MSGLAPDPSLPQRNLLLDDQEMATRLAALISRRSPSPIDSCEKQRIKYRIGESLRVLYRLSVSGRTHLVAAKAFAGSYTERIAQFVDSDLQAAFWMFPNDRKIKHLTLLREAPETLTTGLAGQWRQSECVAYVPEKCATVRCQNRSGDTIAYAKMYAAAEGRKIGEIYIQLSSTCTHVVKPLEYSESHNLLLLEAIQGNRISDLKNDDLSDGFAGLAQALAALHSTPITTQLPRFRRHDPERLRNCARIVGIARPDVAALSKEVDRELWSTAAPEESLVWLHGDVHPKNGIASSGLVTLIDLDQSGVGPAAADLGSLLALLHYNWRIGLITRSRERELANAFLDAYARALQLPSQRHLSWHTAAALLSERALRSVNRIRPEGLNHLPQILNDAREILWTGGVRT